MDKTRKYAAVNTKVHSLYGKLLNNEDYKKIISLKTPSEIAVYLKNNTSYKEILKGRDPSIMRRASIERALRERLVYELNKLMHYLNDETTELVKCFFIRHEIEELKRVARLIHIDKDYNNLSDGFVFLGRYSSISQDKMKRSTNISELIQSLEDTVYYPFLKNLIGRDEKENLYRFEMSLDKAFFSTLDEKVNKLSKADKEAFYELYGYYVDMLNLQWIYRAKKFYSLSPEEIFNYAANKGLKFDYKKIKDFCYSNRVDEFVEKIKSTPYTFMFKGDNMQDVFMERRLNRFMYYKIRTVKKKFKFDISSLLCYLQLIEFETKDIISMIENVRYGMDYEETKKYLIKAI